MRFWKKETSPSLDFWTQEISEMLHMERIRYTLIDKLEEFEKIWLPFSSFLEENIHSETNVVTKPPLEGAHFPLSLQ